VSAAATTRRVEEAERIARLSTAMSDRIARQPEPDPVLNKTASTLAELAGLLLATCEQVTP
jgi:hypothetical protein